MSAQHTPGRLTTDEAGHDEPYQDIKIKAGEHHTVCTVWIDDAPVRDFNATQRENARRLVACWNACESVPTEVLEAQQSGGLPWSVADQIEQRVQFDAYKEGSEEAFGAVVEQKRKAEECVSRMESTIQSQQGVIVKMRTQRDELLAALKEVADTFGEDWMEGSTQRRLGDLARAAIAKVESGK